MHFSSKMLTTFLVVALKNNAADCFTVKIKQSIHGNIFISVHTIAEAKQ